VAGFGQLVKPESVPELAEAMRDWAARPAPTMAGRTELHEKVASQFSVLAFAKRMLEYYRTL
jgi:glycosyltransferase involved in cell wall biosynthesis